MEMKLNLATVDVTQTTPIGNQFEDDNVKLIKYSNKTVRNKESTA